MGNLAVQLFEGPTPGGAPFASFIYDFNSFADPFAYAIALGPAWADGDGSFTLTALTPTRCLGTSRSDVSMVMWRFSSCRLHPTHGSASLGSAVVSNRTRRRKQRLVSPQKRTFVSALSMARFGNPRRRPHRQLEQRPCSCWTSLLTSR